MDGYMMVVRVMYSLVSSENSRNRRLGVTPKLGEDLIQTNS